MRSLVLVVAVALCSASSVQAQCEYNPPPSDRPLFVQKDLFVAGGFVLATGALMPLDRYTALHLQDSTLQRIPLFQTGSTVFKLLGFPGPVIVGPLAYAVGRVTDHPCLSDVALHGVEAILVGVGITQALKIIAGRARPYVGKEKPHDFKFGRGLADNRYQSFPSGHTTVAFASAAAITAEASRLWPDAKVPVGVVMYGGAGLVGISRMYNDQHWLSDVVMGAAIGTFSGLKVVLYNHREPGNFLDRLLLSTSIAPNGQGGITLAFRPLALLDNGHDMHRQPEALPSVRTDWETRRGLMGRADERERAAPPFLALDQDLAVQ